MGQDTNQEALTHKETSTWSRMEDGDDEVPYHAHRLCEGYLDLLKFGDGAVQRKAKMASSSPNAKYIGPISALLIKSENKEKGSVNPPIIKYDATDDRSEARSQCMARRPLKKKEKIKAIEKVIESSDRKPSDDLKKIQMDREKNKIDLKNSKEKADIKIQRIIELNRIYNDYLKAWQQPYPNQIYQNSAPTRTFSFSGLKLSALNDLINVLEHFQQGNLVNDLAKQISQEMEPNLPKQINQDAQLVSESRASLKGIIKNDLSGLFDVKATNASSAFKNILADLKSRKSQIKAGKLYDEYKKGFYRILSDHKHPRQLDVVKANRNPTKINEHPLEGYIKTKSYLKALQAFVKMNKESSRNGGSKPYYIPMAKSRQLVHNDIPLIKPGVSEAPKKAYNKENYVFEKEKPGEYNSKDFIEQDTTNFKKPAQNTDSKECISPWKDWYSGVDSKNINKDFPKQETTNLKKPVQKISPKEPFITSKDIYSEEYSKQISNGVKAIKNASFFNLLEEYQKQVESLNEALKNKQNWWKDAKDNENSPCPRALKRNTPPLPWTPKRNTNMNNLGTVPFPEVLVNQAQQIPANVLGNMASQLNVSPIEMARRIVGVGQAAPAVYPRLTVPQCQSGKFVHYYILFSTHEIFLFKASQLGCGTIPKCPEIPNPSTCQTQDSQQQQPVEISPVLDKILQRLESIQATKCNKSTEEEENLPCCFVDPADGAPCDINGSWESLVLGIRINIKSPNPALQEDKPVPICCQPKTGRAKFVDHHHERSRRQCVKKDPVKLKKIADAANPKTTGIPLNVSVQETVPPRDHDLLDNLTDWHFAGTAQMILGGPISLSFRKNNSNLIGHFVGYCRNCGCLDTIFGSWTFCQPSRDCQDIFMSIVDRRDMLRRYNMDERRKNRYKEQLFLGSKFAKMEAMRLRKEQKKIEKHHPQGHYDSGAKG
ncbi:hypothetical protein KR200_009459 [Drosophila serrata]|nr:hypothetical protein KR200_009459 [Drosophila serrata]